MSQDTSHSLRLAVCCDSDQPGIAAQAEDLANRLDLPLVRDDARDYPLLLAVTDERLELRQTDSADGPVYCDFEAGAFGYRRTRPLRHELLAKAISFKGRPLDVIDMTAGFGRDAVLLALLGCRVTAVERDPVVFALLEDGLRRARRDPDATAVLAEHLTLVRGDACRYLDALPPDARPDVIYLDPMFPARRQSALVKKEMRALARLIGAEEDADRLLRAALRTHCRRVVIKRPLHAPPLLAPGGKPPALQLRGRAARFDVYFPT